jgi:hypothetical protein
LTDAIAVLKHVVGLTAPEPSWHFVNEIDASVPGISPAGAVAVSAISTSLSSTSPVHVGLVGYLRGDVDGSYAGVGTEQDLDTTHPGYFVTLVGAHPELSLGQFGVY